MESNREILESEDEQLITYLLLPVNDKPVTNNIEACCSIFGE